MSSTYAITLANGSTQNFAVPFAYLDKAHVYLSVNGVVDSAATWPTTSTIRASFVPTAGATVEVRRRTPKDAVPVDFEDGSVLSQVDLDLLATYAAYLSQEAADYLTDALQPDASGQFTARNLRVKNLAQGVADTDAVNVAQLMAQQASLLATIGPMLTQTAANAATANAAISGISASATAAQGAATTASNAATTASNAATAAGTASSTAQTAAGTASTAATTATNKAGDAQAAATTATTKAAEAASSASQASNAASGVTAKATEAANSATQAAQSATAAANSASQAQGILDSSVNAAAASATSAGNSATAAANSATAANVAKVEWKGAWASGTAYTARQAVSYLGSAYIAIAASTNQAPPNASYWDLLASKGTDGANGSGTGDVVSTASASVDGELALFSGTGGKTIRRASGNGLLKMVNGVLGTAIAGTDYLTTVAWSAVTGRPTTLSGFGITDAQPLDADLTSIAALTGTSGLLRKTAADTWTLDTGAYLTAVAWSAVSGKPSTLSGFGITDAQPLDADLTAIAALSGTSGLLKKTAADTWTLDTNTYVSSSSLTAYAPLASPALTGTPTAPTAAVGTNTTQVATTAFVVGQAGTATPAMDGTAAVGTATAFARQDHVHPTDTTRAPLASPTFTGTPTVPTAAAGTNSTQIASTAFVVASYAPLASPTFTGTPAAPTAAAGTATTQIASTAFADALRDIATNTQTASYTLALTDRGKSVDTTAAVVIPANASVAFPVGSTVMVTNTSAASITISITTDTLRLAGSATTGTRTLAQYGVATLRKISSTVWVIAGAGVT